MKEVIIKKIVEPTSFLYKGDELIGKITSSLQLNDCLIQINNQKLRDYNLLYDGERYLIRNNGRIIRPYGKIYPLFSSQLKELVGF